MLKKETIKQEIMLMTETTFLSGEFLEISDASKPAPLNEKEKLVEACWNGLLYTLLPFIFEQQPAGEKLYLWQIKEAYHFLELEFGRSDEPTDIQYSIDPYCFLETIPLN
jgi:hypothetical protein